MNTNQYTYVICHQKDFTRVVDSLIESSQEQIKKENIIHITRPYIVRTLRRCKLYVIDEWQKGISNGAYTDFNTYLAHLHESIQLIFTTCDKIAQNQPKKVEKSS